MNMEEEELQWRRVNVKQDCKRRLKPSNIANPHLREIKVKRSERSGQAASPDLHTPQPNSPFLRTTLQLDKKRFSPGRIIITTNGQQEILSSSPTRSGGDMKAATGTGWNNPDLSSLNRSYDLAPKLNSSGEFELENRQTYSNSIQKAANRAVGQYNQEQIANLMADSVQIQLKRKGGAREQPPDNQTIKDSKQTNIMTQTGGELNSELEMYNEFEQQRRQIVQLTGMDQTDAQQNYEINLLQLAEKYLTSNKIHLQKQKIYERELSDQLRVQQQPSQDMSKMSIMQGIDDQVLIGGRMSQDLPKPVYSQDRTLGTKNSYLDLKDSQNYAEKKVNARATRQIVVQKNKYIKKMQDKVRQPGDSTLKKQAQIRGSRQTLSLLNSLQNSDEANNAGFIYSDRYDNLTISKDILYDKTDQQKLMAKSQDKKLSLKNQGADQQQNWALYDLLARNRQLNQSRDDAARQPFSGTVPPVTDNKGQWNFSFDMQRRISPKTSDLTAATVINDQAAASNNAESILMYKQRSIPPYRSIVTQKYQSNEDVDELVSQQANYPFHNDQQETSQQPSHPSNQMPPIIIRTQQAHQQMMMLGMMQNVRHGTARAKNVPLYEPGALYGAQNAQINTNRHIKTNQQQARVPQTNIQTAVTTMPINENNYDISMQLEADSSRNYIKTIAAGENISQMTTTLKNWRIEPNFPQTSNGLDEMAKNTDNYPWTTVDEASLGPTELPNSLRISHRECSGERRNQMLLVPQTQSQGQHMENVYRAMMPLTGSTSRMGVTITAKPLPERKAERRYNQNNSISKTREDIGQTYMNSFMGRYARQSPKKVSDAEKIFLKRNRSKRKVPQQSRNVATISPIEMRKSSLVQSVADSQNIVDKAAYKTMTTYMGNITSGSTSLVPLARVPAKTQSRQHQPSPQKLYQQVVFVPKTEPQTAIKGSAKYSVDSKLISTNNGFVKQYNSRVTPNEEILTQRSFPPSRSGLASRSQIQENSKEEPFLLDTRTEQLKHSRQNCKEKVFIDGNEQQIDQQDINHISQQQQQMLNQPSQEIRSQKKLQGIMASQNKSQEQSPPRNWVQVPLQHRGSSNWTFEMQNDSNSRNHSKMRQTAQKLPARFETIDLRSRQQPCTNPTNNRGSSSLRTASTKSIQYQNQSPRLYQQQQQYQTALPSYSLKEKLRDMETMIKNNNSVSPTTRGNVVAALTAAGNSTAIHYKKKALQQNRRVVGRTTQVGTIHRGVPISKHLASQDSSDKQIKSHRLHQKSKKLSPPQQRRDNRLSKLNNRKLIQSYFDKDEHAISIQQINNNSDEYSPKRTAGESQQDLDNKKSIENPMQKQQISYRTETQSPFTTRQKKSPNKVSPIRGKNAVISNSLGISIPEKDTKIKRQQAFDIQLLIEGTPNIIQIPNGQKSDLQSQIDALVEPNTVMLHTNISESAKTPLSPSKKPDHVFLVQPQQTKQISSNDQGRNSSLNETLQSQDILKLQKELKHKKAESVMKQGRLRKDTLMLSDRNIQIGRESRPRMQKPQESVQTIKQQGSGGIIVNANNTLQISNAQNKILIGGSRIGSDRNLAQQPNIITLTKQQSPVVNIDLFSVMNVDSDMR